MTPEEALLAAADDIATHGHCKETFYDDLKKDLPERSACAYGALARVTGEVGEDGIILEIDGKVLGPAAKKLADQIRAKGPQFADADDYQTITGYNDMDSTTGEDIILAMKGAAHG